MLEVPSFLSSWVVTIRQTTKSKLNVDFLEPLKSEE